jgi:hypothetical protein
MTIVCNVQKTVQEKQNHSQTSQNATQAPVAEKNMTAKTEKH